MGRAPPGRLFAHDILTGAVLKEDLVENEQYVLLPRAVWALLDSWYGGGDCAVIRSVIQEGTYNKSLRVEVYLLRVRIQECDKLGVLTVPGSVAFYSKKSTVQDVMHSECARLGLDEKNTRCFTMDGEGDEILDETFLDGPQTLDDAMVAPGQRLCFQAKEEDAKDYGLLPSEQQRHQQPQQPSNGSGKKKGGGFFSRLFGRNRRDNEESATGNEGAEMAVPMSATSATSAAMSRREDDGKAVVMDEKGGLRGMQNLGNTCFMNGAVQALLHTEPLVRYFLSGQHKKDLNKKNPMGCKGELASAFADLMREAWRGGTSPLVPKTLKHVVGRFNSLFEGYRQQDSHELLAFLLDGVHEDLNLVREKPAVNMDTKGELSDQQLSAILWDKHLQRNQSVIVDIFQAQLKNTLVCPSAAEGGCGRSSVTFDSYASLALPMPEPEAGRRFVEVAVSRDPWFGENASPFHGEMSIKYSVELLSGELIGDVLEHVVDAVTGDNVQAPVNRSTLALILCEQLNHKLHKVYSPQQANGTLMARDLLFGFLLPRGTSELMYTHVTFSHQKPFAGPTYGLSMRAEGFGLPFMAAFLIDEDYSALNLYKTAWRAISCYLKLWKTVGEPHIFAEDDPSSETVLAVKAEMQQRGPPEGSVQADGIWRVDHGKNSQGRTFLKYQVMATPQTLVEYPFRLRWSTESFNGSCLKCQTRLCPGCDVAETASASSDDLMPPETNVIKWLEMRGRLSMVLYWEDNDALNEAYDMTLGLNVRLNASVKTNRAIVKNGGRAQALSLDDCLSHFQQNEKLDKANTWYCNVCKKHVQAWKMMQIYSLPQVLVIQLKRFRSNGHYRQKIDSLVAFPLQGLDMGKYCLTGGDAKHIYDCFAVVNHSGNLGGGHYTAFVKHNVTGKWYLFDDSSVREVSNTNGIISSAAYSILYLKREEPGSKL